MKAKSIKGKSTEEIQFALQERATTNGEFVDEETEKGSIAILAL